MLWEKLITPGHANAARLRRRGPKLVAVGVVSIVAGIATIVHGPLALPRLIGDTASTAIDFAMLVPAAINNEAFDAARDVGADVVYREKIGKKADFANRVFDAIDTDIAIPENAREQVITLRRLREDIPKITEFLKSSTPIDKMVIVNSASDFWTRPTPAGGYKAFRNDRVAIVEAFVRRDEFSETGRSWFFVSRNTTNGWISSEIAHDRLIWSSPVARRPGAFWSTLINDLDLEKLASELKVKE